MNDSNNRSQSSDNTKRYSGLKALRVVSVSQEDLEKVKEFDQHSCPRRYCWWWKSLSFEWDISVETGCTFLESDKPPGYRDPSTPCCRLNPDSSVDHYEPREPHIIENQVDASEWDELA